MEGGEGKRNCETISLFIVYAELGVDRNFAHLEFVGGHFNTMTLRRRRTFLLAVVLL